MLYYQGMTVPVLYPTREMDDGIASDAAGIAANDQDRIQLVAGYIDSPSFTWTAADWALFPTKVHVRIAVRASTNDGHVLDVENGDATPTQAVTWARMRRASGYAFPTIYCSISAQTSVIAAFTAANEPLPLWWLAHYDNLDQLPNLPNVVAKQYADPGPLDKSVVVAYWPGVDAAPHPLEADMPGFSVVVTGNGELQTVNLPAAGCTNLDFIVSFGNQLQVKYVLCYGATPAQPAPAATGFAPIYSADEHGGALWTIDENRPGPVAIPPGGVRALELQVHVTGTATLFTGVA